VGIDRQWPLGNPYKMGTDGHDEACRDAVWDAYRMLLDALPSSCFGVAEMWGLRSSPASHARRREPMAAALAAAAQPNPPRWPASVRVFGPDTPDIGQQLSRLYTEQNDIFGSGRVALLFKPGRYTDDVPVSYYTTVHGLGASPEDVSFVGRAGVHAAEPGPNNLVQFWRGAENLANRPSSGSTVWSVSQAGPLRRMLVQGDLRFGVAADTQGSGGYVSGVRLMGTLNYTKQQQWISRNCELGNGTAYFQDPPRSVNFVYVGTIGSPAPSAACTDAASNRKSPSPQTMVADAAPVSLEKPYITIDAHGMYSLVTPRAAAGTRGVQWDTSAHVDGFESVFVANNATTSVAEINAALARGLHVVLCPGIYELPEPIVIDGGGRRASGQQHQVLLGLGMATLVPMAGGPAVRIDNVAGVRVAGLLLQAGPKTSDALIAVGKTPDEGDAANPALLADVFARVGGPDVDATTGKGAAVSARVMMEINASHVVLDNVWLWRADVQNIGRRRDCKHGLVVNGHNVTAFGLASEHTQSDNVVWNGEGGRVFFFQAELDGVAPSPEDGTIAYGSDGVSGYRVNAREHHAEGVGVYCWFSYPDIVVDSAVKIKHAETADGIRCPFQWVWENANTPPRGNSTIQAAIQVVDTVDAPSDGQVEALWSR